MIGKLVPDYYVTCAICESGEHVGARTRPEAIKSAKWMGWICTRAGIWLCAVCAVRQREAAPPHNAEGDGRTQERLWKENDNRVD